MGDTTKAEQESDEVVDGSSIDLLGESGEEAQHVGHLREAGRNIQRTAGAGLRREYQDDFIQLRINEQQRQYTFNIMRDFVFLGIFLYYFFFRDILGIRNLMFHFIYTGLTGKIYNETEIQEATNILLGKTVSSLETTDLLSGDIVLTTSLEDILVEVIAPIQKSQPNCTRLEMLHMFVEDYVNKTSLEAWNRQQKNQRVNRSDMVLPIILFLMLASLAATIWEVVQVRFVTGSSTSSDGMLKTKKHSLSRKCSLADLTVLRHDRKELRRKESGLAIYEHHGYGPGDNHGKGTGGGPAGTSTSYNSACASSPSHLQPLPSDSNSQRSFNHMHAHQHSLDSSTLMMRIPGSSSPLGGGVSSSGGLRNPMQHSLSLDNPLGATGSTQGVPDMLWGNLRQRRAFKIIRR